MRNVTGMVIGVGLLLKASSAMAQDQNPPPPPPPPVEPTPPKHEATVTVAPMAHDHEHEHDDAKKDDGLTDHERVVGKFGVMYFGITQQPIGGLPDGATNATTITQNTVSTPVIGARYWFQERMGIDAGIGLGLQSSSQAVKPVSGQPEVDTDGPAVVAFALHAGLPLAFAYGKHYKFLVVPEVNFGYATQTVSQQNVQPNTPAQADIHLTGIRFDVGARVGTEIQFGFIGIPQLALQASIGLNFQREVWHGSQDSSSAQPNANSKSFGQTTFGTTVQSDPWALFVNNIAAIYYFP